jgi:hypothetical protein
VGITSALPVTRVEFEGPAMIRALIALLARSAEVTDQDHIAGLISAGEEQSSLVG